jgi:hypothetical protein
MGDKLFEDSEFKIVHGRDYCLIRKNKEYQYHAHFKRLDGCKTLIELFYKGVMPYDDYFITAMKRICTEEEFNKLREPRKKQKYTNKGRKR